MGPPDTEVQNAGRDIPGHRAGLLCRRHRLYLALRAAVMGDYILAACVTLAVLGYLVFALIRPERF